MHKKTKTLFGAFFDCKEIDAREIESKRSKKS